MSVLGTISGSGHVPSSFEGSVVEMPTYTDEHSGSRAETAVSVATVLSLWSASDIYGGSYVSESLSNLNPVITNTSAFKLQISSVRGRKRTRRDRARP